jgi:hypothetical protein
LVRHATHITTNLYDVYISVPLRLEEWIGRMGDDQTPGGESDTRPRDIAVEHDVRAHGGSLA